MPEIKGYADLTRVGRGGFSVVYRARQVALERPVAIKVMLADLDEEDQVRRFTNECRVLGKLGLHRHVVDVFDAGVTDEGRPFIVMKFYGRGALSDRLKSSGPLSAVEVVDVGVKMAAALQAAHAIGVFHRDVKPDNILVDDEGEPVLTDFGVAAVADAAGQYTSSVAFSRAHVAPEVLDRNAFGVASDVYGLGSTLFTLLTGRAAFAADTEARQIVAIMNDPVPAVDVPGVTAALSAVIATAMAKRPEGRYATAELMRQALLAIDTAVPVDQGAEVTGPRPRREAGAGAGVVATPTVASDEVEEVTVRRANGGLPAEADVEATRPKPPTGPIVAAVAASTVRSPQQPTPAPPAGRAQAAAVAPSQHAAPESPVVKGASTSPDDSQPTSKAASAPSSATAMSAPAASSSAPIARQAAQVGAAGSAGGGGTGGAGGGSGFPRADPGRGRTLAPGAIALIAAALVVLVVLAVGVALVSGRSHGESSAAAAATPNSTLRYVTIDCLTHGRVSTRSMPSEATTLGDVGAVMQPNGTPAITIATDAPPATDLGSADLRMGNGARAQAGRTVTADYCVVALTSRTVVDSSWYGGRPATFPLSGLIDGMQQGMSGMKAGGQRLLVIPAAMAYGGTPPSGIDVDETLVLLVQLDSVVSAGQSGS